ncbi:hypothetical protein CANARDRAFT_221131, partial [[Candida] arabinofermentans NRRL YB-2248]
MTLTNENLPNEAPVTTTPRNLILCFDGTANNFNKQSPTNILKMYKMLEKDDEQQMCYYQPGIGNDIRTGFDNLVDGGLFGSQIEDVKSQIDECVAYTVDYHVIEAYTYLMRYYKKGDKIYLFGFSRGSFIARILTGMIEKIGLLNPGLEVMVSTAWTIYKKWEQSGQPVGKAFTNTIAGDFKRTFCRDKVEIELMGLWDSVNSCGIFRDRMFPFTSITYHVNHIRHAVSIDERRGKFKQNLFVPHSYTPSFFNLSCKDNDDDDEVNLTPISTDLLELWFPGDHSDVGGGWPLDLNGHSMANIPMNWILSSAVEFGVKFKPFAIQEFLDKFTNLDSLLSCHHDCLSIIRNMPYNHPKPPKFRFLTEEQRFRLVGQGGWGWGCSRFDHNLVSSCTINESDEYNGLIDTPIQFTLSLPEEPISLFDCRGDDSFLRSLGWWLVEILPIGYFIENKEGKWRRVFYPNLGRHRSLPKKINVHWSVLWRTRFVKDYYPSNLPDVYKSLIELIKKES